MSKKNNTSFKLLAASVIMKQQDQIAVTGTKMLEMIRENAQQCLAHFKAHGDITLAERLLASLPQGMVVAGLAKWFKDFAPVKFDAKGKAEVTGDHKETKLDEAAEKNWVEDAQVKDRANKPITKPTIAFFKGRIQGFVKQVDRFNESAPAAEKMTDQEVKTVKMWLSAISSFGNQVTVLTDKDEPSVAAVNAKGESRGAVQAAKRNKRSVDPLKSEAVKAA